MTTIRKFCCNDFLRFSSVNLDHLTITGGTRTYFSWLVQWPDYFIVAVAPGNRIMGYILAAVQGDSESEGSLAIRGGQDEGEGWFGQITTISVHPEYRGRGLGTKLMRMYERKLLDKIYFSPRDLSYSMRCLVGVTNRAARIFFGKFGFENYRCLAKAIAKKEDGVDMRKVLVEGGDSDFFKLSTSKESKTLGRNRGEGGIEMESSSAAAAAVAGEREVVVAEVAETTSGAAAATTATTAVVAGEGEVIVAEVAETASGATAVVAGEGEVIVAEVAETASGATAVVAGEGVVVVAEVAETTSDAAAVAGEGEVVVAEVAETTTKKPTRLERRWTLWLDNQSKRKQSATWGSSLQKVYSFDTVEEFWALYDQIIQPSKLPGSGDFHLFKEGIEPKWEDPECANGGKWSVNCSRRTNLDTMWLETLMALIGEQFDESDEICGVVASVRQRQDKLALWTKTATDEATQMSIGRKWKEIIDINEKITYSLHDYAKKEKSAKARYYV